MGTERITLLSSREIDKMRQAGQLAAELLDYLAPMVKPGISTLELNDAAEAWTQARGAKTIRTILLPRTQTGGNCQRAKHPTIHGFA